MRKRERESDDTAARRGKKLGGCTVEKKIEREREREREQKARERRNPGSSRLVKHEQKVDGKPVTCVLPGCTGELLDRAGNLERLPRRELVDLLTLL